MKPHTDISQTPITIPPCPSPPRELHPDRLKLDDIPVIELRCRPGVTVQQIIEESLPESLKGHTQFLVYNHGILINDPSKYYFREGDRLSVYLLPEGGGGQKGGAKGILSLIIGVILIVVTWGFAAIGVAGITGLTMVGQAVAMAGVGLALGGLGSLISGTPSKNTKDAKSGDSTRFLITGQSNQARYYNSVVKVYGKHKIFPAIMSLPYTDNYRDKSDLYAYYDWGPGDVLVANMKVGSVPVSQLPIKTVTHRNLLSAPLQLVGENFHSDPYSVVLERNKDCYFRTRPDAIAMVADISFPYGNISTDAENNPIDAESDFLIYYRQILTDDTSVGQIVPNFPLERDNIKPGEVLFQGETRTSKNGWYRLIMQGDGNLVLYAKNSLAVWDSQTAGNPGAFFYYSNGGPPLPRPSTVPNIAPGKTTLLSGETLQPGQDLVSPRGWYRAVMQDDGNFCIYSKSGEFIWATKTYGNPGSRFVYVPSNIIGLPITPGVNFPQIGGEWINPGETLQPGDIRTSANGWYRVIMQTDGNLVIYAKSGQPVWSTRTSGHAGARAVFFANLAAFVVVSPSNATLWKVGNHLPAGVIRMQGDGNLVWYRPSDGHVYWSAGVSYQDEPGTPAVPAQPPAANIPTGKSNRMNMGDTLFEGWELVSPGGSFRAVMQPDNNFCIYRSDGKFIWGTGTGGRGAGGRLVFFANGWLRLYNISNTVLWDQGPFTSGSYMVLQDDGNLVVYNSANQAKWASHSVSAPADSPPPPGTPAIPATTPDTIFPGTTLTEGSSIVSTNGWYTLVMQGDGNLVIYSKGGKAIWASNTGGHPGSRFVYMTNGEIVIATPANKLLWNPAKQLGGHLVMQGDGNLVLYNSANGAVWSSHSASSVEPAGPAPTPTPTPPPATPTAPPNFPGTTSSFPQGSTLLQGSCLTSDNGWYRIYMQDDGNLVTYAKNGKPIWASNTGGHPGARLVYTNEGHLRIHGPIDQGNRILWAKDNIPGGVGLMQGDGNFVIYRNGAALWHTGVSIGGEPTFLRVGIVNNMEPTYGPMATLPGVNLGGIGVYSPTNQELWGEDVPNGRLEMQDDGNLVVYSAQGKAEWASNTGGLGEPGSLSVVPVNAPYASIRVYSANGKEILWNAGAHGDEMFVQGDGNIVTYSQGAASWATNTASDEEPTSLEALGAWVKAPITCISGLDRRYKNNLEPTNFDANWMRFVYPEINKPEINAQIQAWWRKIGEQAGVAKGPPPSALTIYGSVRTPRTGRIRFTFPVQGTWEMKIRRTNAEPAEDKGVAKAVITQVKSLIPGVVTDLITPHTTTEIKAVANGQLNGVIQNLSAVCHSILPIYNEHGVVVDRKATRNPAWICIDILTGPTNGKPINWEMIDWPAWKALADYCDAERHWHFNGHTYIGPRHTCDLVIDYMTTVLELINSILSGCRSMLTVGLDGKYSVAIDQLRNTPRQLITSANSWDFIGTRSFLSNIKCVRVSFLDASQDYQKQELLVYNDGESKGTVAASDIHELGTFGITDVWQAWAFARYHMATAKHRSEIFTLKMDVENLAFTRGDLVAVAHDVPQVGGQPCRVVSVNGNEVTVNETFSTNPTGYTLRSQDGTVRQGTVTVFSGDRFGLSDAGNVQPDDLLVLGDFTKITKQYLVLAIEPDKDLQATISLVPYVKEIYDCDIGLIPPWDAGLTGDYINNTDLRAQNAGATGQLSFSGQMMLNQVGAFNGETRAVTMIPIADIRNPILQIVISWEITGTNYGYSEIYMSCASVLKEHIGTSVEGETSFTWLLDTITRKDLMGQEVRFEIVPITRSGVGGTNAETERNMAGRASAMSATKTPGGLVGEPAWCTYYPYGDTSPVSPPQSFTVDVQDVLVEIRFDPSPDMDIDHYELRYAPDPVAGDWESSQHITNLPHDVHKTSVGARTGKYFIRAYDTSGNHSPILWVRSTVESLPYQNMITSINDVATGSAGQCFNVQVDPNGHILLEGPDVLEGYYYFESTINLGSIYELRLSNKIEANAWDVDGFEMGGNHYGASLEYRTTHHIRKMSDWKPIETQIPLNDHGSLGWSPWRSVIVSDITARLIEFRIKFWRDNTHTVVKCTSTLVELDAVDWVYRLNDIDAPIEGYQVLFDPPFMDKPVVTVSINGGTSAVTRNITQLSRKGCRVILLDSNGAPCAGNFDLAALGQGKERLNWI